MKKKKTQKVNLAIYDSAKSSKFWEYYAKFFGSNCLVCRKEFELTRMERYDFRVDHDHKTGKVRGIVCNRCNVFLGFLESYSPDELQFALDYLKLDRKEMRNMLSKVDVTKPSGLNIPDWYIQYFRDERVDRMLNKVFGFE